MAQLQVGLVVDIASKLTPLTQLVSQAGHEVVCYWVLGMGPVPSLQPQVWLLDIASDFEDELTLVEDFFNQDLVPVLMIDSATKLNDEIWLKRTQQRLLQLAGDVELHKQKAAVECWILAASTGGPAAIKDFIQSLPANLPVSFVYIQHIDPHQGEGLARSLSKSSSYQCELAEQGTVLAAGKIVLLVSKERIEVLPNKTLHVHQNSVWNGAYLPSIDQLVANVACIYKQSCGLIIFTGLGDDGAASCRLVNQQGGQVWAQSPESATSDSMPKAAIATQCVSLTGTPKELAYALGSRLNY